METRDEVRVFVIKQNCYPKKSCAGSHVSTGIITNDKEPKYIHICETCEEKFYYEKEYPYVDYEEIDYVS